METESSLLARKAAIVFCVDERFVAPALTTMNSIHLSGGPLSSVSVIVLTRGLSQTASDVLHRYAESVQISLSIQSVAEIGQLGNIEEWAVPTCLRLFAGDLVPDFDRILYLDADMIVKGSIVPLLETDLGGKTVAAVVNYPPIDVMRIAIRRSHRGSVNPDAPYFNAGVLVIDTARWKDRRVGERSREYLRSYPSTRLLDQDALNMVLADDWLSLDLSWNAPAGSLDAMPMFAGLSHINNSLPAQVQTWERAQERAKILHFTGKPKPWDDDYPWPELQKLYFDFVPTTLPISFPKDVPQTVGDENGIVRTRQLQRTAANSGR